ncbi:sirohydrochlorin chelatase [Phosphitispora sp. TUW77]|uniref:sirohydrochlorin chelatase n=1 Tax=Phosphitispora sp. TUW77 TaxID=3152361 RepID=UPI003AB6013A
MKTGIIILGHGSRAAEALEQLKKYGEMLKSEASYDIVEIASLQFNQPDLPEAIKKVVDAGADKIIIVPFFLYKGVHMQEDIPEVLEGEKAKYPGLEIVMTNHLGTDRRLVEIIIDRIEEVS